jgi:hypothetical protein
MSTSRVVANIAGLPGSLLLIVQGGIALWRRRAAKNAREQAKESRKSQSPAKTFVISKGAGKDAGNNGGTIIDGATLLDRMAEKAEEVVDRYQAWHGLFFMGGAALLAFSYLLPLLSAWISQNC